MILSDSIYDRKKGEIICRPTEWADVAKFFLFNYGLHAFTVLLEPGSGILQSMTTAIASILMPYAGMSRAFLAIALSMIPTANPLEKAKYALCMVVPQPEEKILLR